VPARHVAPRHRSPRSLKRTLGRFAADAARVLPSPVPSSKAAAVATAGLALGGLLLTADNAAGDSASVEPPTAISAPAVVVVPAAATPVLSRQAVASQAQAILAAHVAGADGLSRSAVRPPLEPSEKATKTSALPVSQQNLGGAVTRSVPPPSPREIAAALLPSYGWDSAEFSCLDAVWTRESDWDPYAANSTSGAYGIPQALPGSKMASYGSDWTTNAETQIKWGLAYIRDSYGSPCGAWSFWQSHNWY
jgi:hypothetical protein